MRATQTKQTQYPRWVLPLAVLTAIAIIAVAFPFKTLWRQQVALNAASSQITQLHTQSSTLTQRAKAVSTRAAAIALAREEYQLVQPGQRLIQVLPGNGAGYVALNSTDPGLQPLVNPTSGPLPSSTTPSPASTSAPAGFVSRFVRTLEFWR